MATITTAVNPAANVLQFDTLPGISLQNSGVPRSRIVFDENFASTGTGASDVEDLYINLDLPPNYFYRPLAFGVTFYVGTQLSTWDDNDPLLEIRENLPATHYMSLEWNPGTRQRYGAASNQYSLSTNADLRGSSLFGQLIDGRSRLGIDPRVRFRAYNDSNSAPVALGNVYASFLQYDISQGLDYRLFYPGNALS